MNHIIFSNYNFYSLSYSPRPTQHCHPRYLSHFIWSRPARLSPAPRCRYSWVSNFIYFSIIRTNFAVFYYRLYCYSSRFIWIFGTDRYIFDIAQQLGWDRLGCFLPGRWLAQWGWSIGNGGSTVLMIVLKMERAVTGKLTAMILAIGFVVDLAK